MTLGAFASSSFAGPIARFMGRRGCIWVASVLCAVANTIMMATTNIGALYFGRLLIGLANGMFMTFSQLYIQESTPARYRGLLISSFQVWTSVGTLVGTIVDNVTSELLGRESYLIPLGIILVVPCFLSLGLFWIPESPRWLLEHGHRDKALASLRWHRPYGPRGAERELRAIQAALDSETQLLQSTGVKDLFANPVDRRRTVLSILAITLQGASGAMYMIGACTGVCPLREARVLLTDHT